MDLTFLQVLYDSLSRRQCLCHLDADRIISELDLSQCRGQISGSQSASKQREGLSTTDELFLRLGLLVSLSEVDHCARVRDVQRILFQHASLHDMWSLVGDGASQLTSFTASKCVKALIIRQTQTSPTQVAQFLQDIVHHVIHTHKNGGPSTVSRVMFTFDLLVDLCQRSDWVGSSERAQEKKCACRAGSSLDSNSMQDKQAFNLSRVCSPSIEALIVELSPSFAACSEQDPTSRSHLGSFYTWLQSLNCSLYQEVSYSFFRLVHTFVKHHDVQQTDPLGILPCVQSTLPCLVMSLRSYCHNSVANMKVVFLVLIESLGVCIRSNVPPCDSSVGTDISTQNSDLMEAFSDLFSALFESSWLENLPYHTGRIGLGGSDFESDEEFAMLEGEYTHGDHSLLRKLARLVIRWLECDILLRKSLTNISYLQKLIDFIREKLTVFVDRDDQDLKRVQWLFDLFGDQDDALVGNMLSLLKSWMAIRDISCHADPQGTKNDPGSDFRAKSTDLPESTLEGRLEESQVSCILNPHQVFVAFLQHSTWDHSILLDLLISVETDFLEYFTRYLRCAIADWAGLVGVFGQRTKLGGLDDEAEAHLDASCEAYEEEYDDQDDESTDDSIHDESTFNMHGHHARSRDENINADSTVSGECYCIGETRPCSSKDDSCEKSTQFKQGGETNCTLVASMLCARKRKLSQISPNEVKVIIGENISAKGGDAKEKGGQNVYCDRQSHLETTGNQEDMFLSSTQMGSIANDAVTSDGEGEGQSVVLSESNLALLDDTMTILIRLRMAIERLEDKNLFPFSAKPLLRLLTKVENLYENDDGQLS